MGRTQSWRETRGAWRPIILRELASEGSISSVNALPVDPSLASSVRMTGHSCYRYVRTVLRTHLGGQSLERKLRAQPAADGNHNHKQTLSMMGSGTVDADNGPYYDSSYRNYITPTQYARRQ